MTGAAVHQRRSRAWWRRPATSPRPIPTAPPASGATLTNSGTQAAHRHRRHHARRRQPRAGLAADRDRAERHLFRHDRRVRLDELGADAHDRFRRLDHGQRVRRGHRAGDPGNAIRRLFLHRNRAWALHAWARRRSSSAATLPSTPSCPPATAATIDATATCFRTAAPSPTPRNCRAARSPAARRPLTCSDAAFVAGERGA